MNRRFFAIPKRLAAGLFFAAVAAMLAPASEGAGTDVNDVGYVDQARLAGMKAFLDANRQLADYKAGLDRQFAQQMRGVRDQSKQQRIAQDFQGRLAAKQRAVLGPLFARAQVAIASVASSRNLSVVVDKQIIIVGGQDITQPVIDLFSGIGEPVPPVSTPPPSNVGYVDQTQIDAVPKLKSVNDQFAKFQADQQRDAQTKMRSAKTDADRQQIYNAMQKALADKKHQLIDPLVDQTRSVIANVAKKRSLVLVIDKVNRIYGGTDITTDVTNGLK
ncbi:MAG: OmpH family outer membrane protein [Candidatus Eremiobacteraeota bacterium]|nr:OmpH family outer membrane protein [Candidatus Eremiobacteraeota bacterium]